jgi:ribosomal protein S18 acetylase RimI-like enzyme
MSIVYRRALPADCLQIAELIRQASLGAVDYLFQGLLPDATPAQVVAYGLGNPEGLHSHINVIVAADGPKILGMVLSFPSEFHRITDEMREFIPGERLARFTDFYAARVEDSWYIDAICVAHGHRRQGMGLELMRRAMDRGRENGFATASLLVFADNFPAIALYERLGFETVRRVRQEPIDQIASKDGYLLMRCNL